MKTIRDRFTKHWKTTIAGLVTSVIIPVVDLASNGEVSNRSLILSGVSLFLGWAFKDRK